MRIASGSLILTIPFMSLLQFGCGDNGGGDTDTQGQTATTVPTTIDPSVGGTETDPSAGTTMNGTTGIEEPTTGMSATGTTDPTTTTDATTDGSTSTPVDPTTSTDGTTTANPDTDGTTGETPCEEIKATLKPVEPNIMLVLDKSGSMVANPSGFWDHDANPDTPKITRWNSLYQVVQSILTDYNDVINFGANLFPSTAAQQKYDSSACIVNADVEIPVSPKNKDAILNGIPAAGEIKLYGGTPASAGVLAALNHLKTLDPAVPRAMLLVTDGAANCAMGAPLPGLFEAYDQNLHTVVKAALADDGIPTYVVGIDTKDVVSNNDQDGNPNGTNTYQKLNELAVDGGKPKDDPNEKFYNAVNQIQLKAALDIIAADALSCTIPLVSEPGFPEKTKVVVGGKDIPMVTDCATENGWVYDNPMGPYTAVILCGTACEDLKVAKAADVEYYCTAG